LNLSQFIKQHHKLISTQVVEYIVTFPLTATKMCNGKMKIENMGDVGWLNIQPMS